MAIERTGLEEIDGSGATDGQVPVWNATDDVWQPGSPATTGVQGLVEGANVVVDSTDPAHPKVSALVPLTTEIGGVPYFVWDDDNNLVTTEAP